ncbi:hypothetical protein CAEBREN_17317 [Caenorhabditis brenneri]|uniref:DUF38 domain-containing protein n=1 Tax=Caenorhabditis brenneri TaxID=135651 RepID=G0NW96_CAEBE|nr:hypothetical protein CAEBREN_17317 [Caenorhabditis brenneri]
MDPQPLNREIQKLISNEFDDRRSPEEALENIRRFLISGSERKNREAPRAEGPPPKMSKQSEEQDFLDSDVEEEMESTREEDIDSDDDGIEFIDEVGDDKESIEPFDVLTLDVVKRVYRNLGRDEISVFTEYNNGRLELEEVLEILHIRKLTPIKLVNLPIDSIEVHIGHRQITLEIRHSFTKTTALIDYICHEDGCLFIYEEERVLVKGIKYQSLAAKDLFYMIRHPDAKFEYLGIDIMEHENPVMYPFRSFFWKMYAYFMNNLSHKIKVTEFFMTTFQYESVPNSAQSFISIFWNFLEPKVLKSAKLRVWNDRDVREKFQFDMNSDRNVLKDLYATEQWQHLRHLDIYDFGIVVKPKDYRNFIHLETIDVRFPRNEKFYSHFKALLKAFGKHDRPDKNLECTVTVNPSFHIQESFFYLIEEKNIVDCNKIFYYEKRNIFFIRLKNGGRVEISDARNEDEGILLPKKIVFKVPRKGKVDRVEEDIPRKDGIIRNSNKNLDYKPYRGEDLVTNWPLP